MRHVRQNQHQSERQVMRNNEIPFDFIIDFFATVKQTGCLASYKTRGLIHRLRHTETPVPIQENDICFPFV